MRTVESITVGGFGAGSAKWSEKGRCENPCYEINLQDLARVRDFLSSIGMIMISIYKLYNDLGDRRVYSVAASLSRRDPVQLITINVCGDSVYADSLNNHQPTI